MLERELNSNDGLTMLLKEKGVRNWSQSMGFVREIPYGRNSNRTDLSLIVKENKGSCSSKHAFLARIAELNAIPNVKLILGIYKMNRSNTPGIGDELERNAIGYIPEAHCYLKIDGTCLDLTSANADFQKLKNDILEEIVIVPEQVADFKIEYHKNYLKKWLTDSILNISFDELWNIREQCIKNLSGEPAPPKTI